MVEDQIENLQALREQLQGDSCLPKEPFMKLGNGSAPTLDYNLPQNSTFSTYGDVPLDVDASSFKQSCFDDPTSNYFNIIDSLNTSDLQLKFSESVQLQDVYSTIVPNISLLHNNLDLEKTDMEAAAANSVSINVGENVTPKIIAHGNFLNELQWAKIAKQEEVMPVVTAKLNGLGTQVGLLKRPQQAVPRIYIIEEYKTSSFLGNYGAGKTIQTFSLLPGEKTTLTIKTYKENTSTKTRSENLLDSVSQNSVDEMERLIEEESGTSDASTESVSKNSKLDTSLSTKLFKIVNAAASAGVSRSQNRTANRTSNTHALNRALGKHVSQSNSVRNIDINTSSTDTVTEGEEMVTIREIENINKSRVLNFVFRQLLQEYVSITYLSNIRIAYTNGYMETLRVVDLEDLDCLLEDVIVPAEVENVKKSILKSYLSIINYQGTSKTFIQEKNISYEAFDETETESFYTRSNQCESYTVGNMEIDIPGVILEVQTNILRTPSVVVDALLGQGEALDCFNLKAQDAIVIGENLKNLEQLQKMEVVEGITDPEQKATLYKKVFGECCECPQTQIING